MLLNRSQGEAEPDEPWVAPHRSTSQRTASLQTADDTPPGRSDPPRVRGDASALRLLTAEELAGILNVKKSWIYDEVALGHLPVLRLGRQLRFRPHDVMRYLEGLLRNS